MAITTLDWIIIIAYAIGMLLVGFHFSRTNKSTDDYMLGGRKMSPWKVGLSLFATIFSAVSYLSLPGEMVKYGPMIWSSLLALPLAYFVVANYFIPYIMKLKITSAYELLETKLDFRNRIVAASYFLIMRIVWMAVIIYMVSDKVVVPIMDWPEETALLVSIVMGVVTIIYTSFGGLKSVVLTDVVQTFILFGGSIVAIVIIVNKVGGISHIIPTEWPNQWAEWKFFDPKARVSFLPVILTTFGWYVCTAGSDQMAIQRYLATKDVGTAQKMYLNSILSNALVTILLAILGLALFAYFKTRPELFLNGPSIVEGADLLFPKFIVMGLPAGFSGLVLAGLLAASMSSISSGINASAMSITNDFILRFSKKSISDKDQMKIAKYISFGIGFLIVLLSFLVGNIKGNLLELSYKTINSLVAPLFVPFFMAMFIKKAKPTATLIGTLSSGVAAILISFSHELFGKAVSFLWIIPCSFAVGVLTALLLSFISFKPKQTDGHTG